MVVVYLLVVELAVVRGSFGLVAVGEESGAVCRVLGVVILGGRAGGVGEADGLGGVRGGAAGASEGRGGRDAGAEVFGSGKGRGEGGVVWLLGC